MLKENKEVKAMELSERKQKILKAIVDLYIRSAEPVAPRRSPRCRI